mgnify:CR=1 FL=1
MFAPYPYQMIMIGIPERNVPNTGMNPNINTTSESVNIYGNASPPWKKLITRSPNDVRMALTRAMIDCARKISPNPVQTFFAIIAHSS